MFERRHLESLGHFAFRDAGIAERAQHNGRICRFPIGHLVGGFVPQAHSCSGGRNGLHTGGRRLVWDLGFVGIAEAGMNVVSTAAGEWVLAFGHELEHQVVRAHPDAEQHGFIPVIRIGKILWAQVEGSSQLNRLVAARGGVNVFGSEFEVFFIHLSHPVGGSHEAEGFGQDFGIGLGSSHHGFIWF